MSYVTLDHLRPYLIANSPAAETVTDQPFRFSGLDWQRFHGGAVDSATVRVKSRRANILTRIQLTLTDSPVQLSISPVVADSLLVASNSSLSHIYQPNIDYIFDTHLRTLATKPGGALSSNTSVTVWFEPFTLYFEGSDYSLNADRGELRRLPSGSIADGESVLLDFTPLYVPFSDDLLDTAIAEANGIIEREIDPDKQFGTDPTLSAAARSLALEIIFRAAAARELLSGRSLDKIALAWESLAATHAARAERLLKSFRPPLVSPKSPTVR